MKTLLLYAVATGMLTIMLGSQGAEARPYPDRTGICYFFQGESQELRESCVISSGYGAGAQYVVLHWSDGVDTQINMINNCPGGNYDEDGFCVYTVDDHEAESYDRDVFLNPTTIEDPENLSCFRVQETGNSVCYRFSDQ